MRGRGNFAGAAIMRASVKRRKQSGKAHHANPSGSRKARVIARAKLPTRFGRFTVVGIAGRAKGEEAIAIEHGRIRGAKSPLVRVHSQCLTGDVFASERCDCRAQLEMSLQKIAKERAGIVLYMPQEGRGIGLLNKLKAY